MSLFKRFKDLMTANLSELLNKAEDPEKMLNLYIEQAIEELKEFNLQVNKAVADELLLKQKIEGAKKEIDSWTSQAKTAIAQSRDDLAKIALERKQTAQNNLNSFSGQLEEQEKIVEQLRENYRILEQKLEKARQEKDALIMRKRRADALKQAGDAVQKVSSQDALNDFGRMRDKVDRMEAEAQAVNLSVTNTIENEFDKLKETADKSAVDDELAKMKAEMGK